MAYIKTCNKCGARISMRQMSQGQWVAFDVSSDEPHEHGVAGKKSERVEVKKSKLQKNNSKAQPHQIIDRAGALFDLSNLPFEWIDLTESNLMKLFIQVIEERRSVQIQYEDKNGDFTNREIYPISLIQGFVSEKSSAKSVKVVSFCKLREDYRTFLLSSIDEILVDKKIPKTFLSKFHSLDTYAKNNILNGTNFYGSYDHTPITSIEDSVGHAEITKAGPKIQTKVKSKPKAKPKPANEPSPADQIEKKEKSFLESGWFWFWAIYLVIVIFNS